jgi:hypothetical protein
LRRSLSVPATLDARVKPGHDNQWRFFSATHCGRLSIGSLYDLFSGDRCTAEPRHPVPVEVPLVA